MTIFGPDSIVKERDVLCMWWQGVCSDRGAARSFRTQLLLNLWEIYRRKLTKC